MWITDFEFCDQKASVMGLMTCSFNSGGLESVSSGSNIEFTTMNPIGTGKWYYLSSRYTQVLTTTFQICKNVCHLKNDDDIHFTLDEIRIINRWLNRKDGYHKFKINCEDVPGYEEIFFNAYINVNKIELNGNVVGFELTVTTDKPYGYFEPRIINLSMSNGGRDSCVDISDEIGISFPLFEIKCRANGDLTLTNLFSKKTCRISGCRSGEVITMDSQHKILSSSIRGDDIMKYFNFGWLDIKNSETDRLNTYESSLACNITLTYNPVAKVGF